MHGFEVNFDGLVGNTHNYSGLSFGNIASTLHADIASNPKEAALQGLEKMRLLQHLGIKQAVLPPQQRPHIPTLRALGFSGSDEDILRRVVNDASDLIIECASAASMWAANAATVSPSKDTLDKFLHITIANLSSKFHRSIEAKTTYRIFKAIFSNEHLFKIHSCLPPGMLFADEGAANHTRLCKNYEESGIELFVYGRKAIKDRGAKQKRFPARQSFEASVAIARIHKLDRRKVIYARQSTQAIDAGVFHNDVIAVGNKSLFFYHEKAYENTEEVIERIEESLKTLCHIDLVPLLVKDSEIPLEDAVSSYLFNSQIVTTPDAQTYLIAPEECRQIESVKKFLDTKGHIFDKIYYRNLRQSMQNGGGPACLRLRVAMTPNEFSSINQGVILDDNLYAKLVAWVQRHYRDKLVPKDLFDPKLLLETKTALDELTIILNLGSIYDFQKEPAST